MSYEILGIYYSLIQSLSSVQYYDKYKGIILIFKFHNYDGIQRVYVPLNASIFKPTTFWLIPKVASCPRAWLVCTREGTIKVNQGNFYRPGVVQNNVFWLKVSVNEPQVEELMQPSDNLKQNLIEFTMVAVLSEVLPEIHRVPIKLKVERVNTQKHSLQSDNILTLMLLRQGKNLILIVELLSKSTLFLKALVSTDPEHIIIPYLSL